MAKKGFTLVEIIVVLVVIAILAAIIIPGLVGFIDKAAIKADIASLGTLNRATQLYTISSGMIGQDVFEYVTIGSSTDLNEARMQHLVDNGALNNIIKAKHAKNEFIWSKNSRVWSINTLDETTLGLTGDEAISKGFTFSGGVITGYEGGSDVKVPYSIDGVIVTSISGAAFKNKGLTSLKLPDSIITIGPSAFQGNNLESVILSASLKEIKQGAFDNNDLKTVTIPDGVGILEYAAFRNNKLTEVVLGTVGTIGHYAFEGNQLTSITFPSSVKVIGQYAFKSNGITSITIPSSVEKIEQYIFMKNELENVIIQSGNTVIQDKAFYEEESSSSSIPSYVPGEFIRNENGEWIKQ